MTDKEILNFIASALSKCESVTAASLYGSRARGDNKERSDYDVAIYGSVSAAEKNAIFSALQNAPTLLKIDVVFYGELEDGKFKNNIDEQGVKFYDGKIEK